MNLRQDVNVIRVNTINTGNLGQLEIHVQGQTPNYQVYKYIGNKIVYHALRLPCYRVCM